MTKAPNPNFKETIKHKLEGQHFMHLIGFDLTRLDCGVIEGEMFLQQKHMQQLGFVHGGVTSTILDITMGFAAYSVVPEGKAVVTANISIDFLNPGDGEKIIAIGEVEKSGSKLVFTQGKVFTEKDGKQKLIATARSIMAIIDVPN
ncbi:MAG: PaaI family thioesterase [Bacteroidia bacterium]|nr:PaaI family thioesterase [Bacteroidia bacterium]